jgi:hypothetical protein
MSEHEEVCVLCGQAKAYFEPDMPFMVLVHGKHGPDHTHILCALAMTMLSETHGAGVSFRQSWAGACAGHPDALDAAVRTKLGANFVKKFLSGKELAAFRLLGLNQGVLEQMLADATVRVQRHLNHGQFN